MNTMIKKISKELNDTIGLHRYSNIITGLTRVLPKRNLLLCFQVCTVCVQPCTLVNHLMSFNVVETFLG